MTLWSRTTDPRYPATIDIYNETDSVILASANLEGTLWAKTSLMFDAPAVSGKTLKVRFSRPASPGSTTSYIDEVSLEALTKTEAAGWTRESTPLANAHRINDSTLFADDWGLRLVHDGVSAPVISSPLHNYSPDSEYGISFSGKVTPGTTGQIRIVDRTTSATLASWNITATDRMAPVYDRFSLPAAGHDVALEVTIVSGSEGQTAWVDAIVVGQLLEHMVHEGLIGSNMLRFANAVYADSSLHTDYLAKADTYRNFVADNLVHKWDLWWRQIGGSDGSNNGAGVYIFPSGFSTEWFPARSLPHNQYLAFAEMLYELYDATEGASAYTSDRPYYWSRANDMGRAFQSTLQPHPQNSTLGTDAYLWHYWDSMGAWDNGHFAVYTSEDLSHASLTLVGPRAAFSRGQLFTVEDMNKFTRTLTDVMWNQSLSEPILAANNDRRPMYTVDQIRTNQLGKFAYFAEFDPIVRDITLAVCETISCTPVMATASAAWSRNKTVNADFELVNSADSSLPQDWIRWQSNSSNAYRTESDSAIGDASVAIVTNGSTWQALEQQLGDYEPNTVYTVSFMGKKYGSINGRVQVYNYTTSAILGELTFSDTSWTRKSYTFTTPSNTGDNIRVRLYTTHYTTAGQKVGFDDVHAYPSLIGTEVANAGFETADRWDTTLPRYWKRGNTTSSTNVLLDTTDRAAGGSALKVVSAAGPAVQELLYDWRGYLPSGSYTVSFQGKVSGSAGGKVSIIDTSTSTELASAVISSSGWSTSTMTFTAPSAYNRTLQVVIRPNNPSLSGTLWVDELNVYSN